jgi:hypothetical protein
MSTKHVFIFSLVVASLLAAFSVSGSESREIQFDLSVRQLPNHQFEAVLAYDINACGPLVSTNPTVTKTPSKVSIVSAPQGLLGCIEIGPIEIVELVANIGNLAPGEYLVRWSQGPVFSISIDILVLQDGSNVRPGKPIPTTSTWAMLLLILGILVGVRSALRTRSPSV